MTIWFEKLVGKENISDEIVDREVYSTDGSQIKGNAKKVVWVNNAREVHQIVLYAKRNKMDIVPRGAGTNLVGSTVPLNSIVIDFTKMDKLVVGKDYVIAEPGVVLEELNARLDDKFFPVIPEDSNVCTIGGMCGINSTGIYERKYGRMKEWVEEVEMIDGNGKLKKYGSEVIGMEGVIGVITNVKLKLSDKVHERSMDVFKFQRMEDAVTKVAGVIHNRNVLAIEFISRSAAILSGLEDKYYLIVEYEGLEGDIRDNHEMNRIWKIRKGIFSNVATKGFIFMEDASLPIDNLVEMVYWLEKKGVPCFGPAGSGILFPCFDERKDIKEFYEYIKTLKGRVGSVFGYGLLKKEFVPESLKNEIIRLKEEFDPLGIMNKGKVI